MAPSERSRITAAAKGRKIAAEAEEQKIVAKKRKAELEVEKLRLKLEARRLFQSRNGEQLNQASVENIVSMPPLPSFVAGKGNLNEYLLRFERHADVAKWNRSILAT